MIAGIVVRAKSGSVGVNVLYRSLMVSHNRNVPASQPSNANVRNSQGRTIRRVAMRPSNSTVKNSARVFNAFEIVLSKLEIIIYVYLYNKMNVLYRSFGSLAYCSKLSQYLEQF